MKKLLMVSLLVVLLLAIPAMALAGGFTPLERTQNAGWSCVPIGGDPHCFDPGDGHSKNASTVNVKVYNASGEFLGTEQLWTFSVYAGQPCPQHELLNLGWAMACHHYDH